MSLIKKAKNNTVLKPILNLGKKYVYNIYRGAKFKASEFPPEVWIENTNVCNAQCIMCPREKHTRKQGFMDMALYEKLIKEIAGFGKNVKRVHMHNYGEPLIDRYLIQRIRFAKEAGIKHTYFVTNASLLTPEISRQLIEAGLDEFKVSFYGTDTATYNKTMKGLDFNKTFNNLRVFFKIRTESGKASPKVVIQYLPLDANASKTKEFLKMMNPFINEEAGDSLNISTQHSFGDGIQYFSNGPITNICNYPWRTIVILNDGKVVLCCLDYNGIQVIGDVNKNTIQEIWKNEKYSQVRNDFKKLKYEKYPICMKCSAIR